MRKLDLRLRDYLWLVIILLLAFYCLNLNTKLKVMENNQVERQPNTIDQLEEGNNINDLITLYFPDSNAQYLIGEEKNIRDISPQKAVQALIEGPQNKELGRSLPNELEVTDVSIKDGVAYVYIHESVPMSEHGNYGSSTATHNIINSISATLILHEAFDIRKVKLEGDVGELLYGIDTKNTLFDVDMSQIKEN